MPPESEGVAARARTEIAVLRAWIDQGAKAPPEPIPEDPRRHWAYPAADAAGDPRDPGPVLGAQPDRRLPRRRASSAAA